MAIWKLAIKSLLNRRLTALLTIVSIAFSIMLLLGVERVRHDARSSFSNTISGTDLVVGARSGSIQLLLYAVFHIGNATNNISWSSYQKLSQRSQIKWTIPLALGDSHKGYRVVGSNKDLFKHYQYGNKQSLQFTQGQPFQNVYDVVLGAEVARKLGYKLGKEIFLAHGAGNVSFAIHDDKPFNVVGILAPTGTPIDKSLYVPLEGIEAIHIDWKQGTRVPGRKIDAEAALTMNLTPKSITAFLVGLKSRITTFRVQRSINNYKKEPLLAVLPGVALTQLWQLMSTAEQALLVISGFVVIVGLTGMVTVMLTSLNERRREMAILRSVGARPHHIFGLIMGESFLISLSGIILGTTLLYGLLAILSPYIETHYGLRTTFGMPSSHEWFLMSLVLFVGSIVSLWPAWRAYRYSLADGMSIRL